MGITVGELLEIPHLRLRLHSGLGGLTREVAWTHTSDLPDPWQWLTSGDLLMTNGMSFPPDGAGQERLVEELDGVGASGLAIGEQMYCPALTASFTAASNRLGLPVLWIRYPLPFTGISRAVAEATLLEQSQRLMHTARIYDALRLTAADTADRSRIARALTRELGCRVLVCDRGSGAAYYPGDPAVAPELSAAVRRAAEGVLVAGARSVALSARRSVLVIDIPTHPQAALVVVREEATVLDGILLQHAATVAGLELSQARLSLERRRRAGAELMAQLLDGRTDAFAARNQLVAEGLDPAECVVVAAACDDQTRVRDLHLGLWRNQIPHILALRDGVAQGVVPDTPACLHALASALGPSGRVGVSINLQTPTRVAEATREAVWALGTGRRLAAPVVRYGHASDWTGFGSVEEAAALVEVTLGPLIAHDHHQHSELLATLHAFLANQRSWQNTAAALHVHRQTVLYRIRRIEQLTGRDLSETPDLALMWMALQARKLLAGDVEWGGL